MSKGTLYPKTTMFLRMAVGNAQEGGNEYELSSSMNGAPMVLSKQTGKTYVLSWGEIIDMAVEAGLDDPKDIPEPKDET